MELYTGNSLEEALQAGHEHLRGEFYRAFSIERTATGYVVNEDTGPYDNDNVQWTYDGGLDIPAEWDDHSRLLESYEYLDMPKHYMYHLPYLQELEVGEAYLVFPFIAWDADLERDIDGNPIDEFGYPTDDLAGHGIAAILTTTEHA